MSFILDALKKSETERQQQSNAEFAAVPSATSSTSVPRWLWVVGILLLVNLLVLVSLLLRQDTPAMNQPTTGSVPAGEDVAMEAPSSFEQQLESARQRAPVQTPAAQDSVITPAPATPLERVEPVVISQNPAAINSDNVHPTLQEVMANGSMSLPELHLDIHVYAPAAEDRFVFINMSKYREGMQLAEGPMVIEISADGVLLGHQGQSFLLPRE